MQKQLAEADEKLKATILTATSGGGMVEVQITGDKKITAVTIKPEVVDPDDIEMLQDLVVAATNEAIAKAVALEKELKGSNMPGGMF